MRYLIALIIGIAALFGVNLFVDLFSMSRPWGSLLMGSIVGITMVVILLVWEAFKPTHKDTVPAKPAMSDEERAEARAERRARLAAEAGVSFDGIDDSRQQPQSSDAPATETPNQPVQPNHPTSSAPAENEDEVLPKADETSIEAEADPVTLAPDDYDEEATGSSLESPPTGEPGFSVDATEDAESAGTDEAADASASGDETTTGDPESKI